MLPANGERAAVVGISGQYQLAARIVLAKLSTLDWIRVADPSAGVADDFQFHAGGTRHALQVKWSQYPSSFSWSDLVSASGESEPLFRELVLAWQRIRSKWSGSLVVHLRSNEHAATSTPRSGTALAQATAEGPHHFAAFLARSFAPVRRRLAESHGRWADVEGLREVSEWRSPWDALRSVSGLDNQTFGQFIRDFEVHFGPPVDEPLLRPDAFPADSDLQHAAKTLQDLVADPERPVHLTRKDLLERLGWADRLRYRHPHAFPVPTLYAANRAALRQLESRVRELPGGYVALVGPAGSGKSTLLASQSWPGKAVVRYYAFVPDAPDPLSGRGEADSFLHDLAFALEESGLSRSGYGNDLRSQRQVVQDQLERASRRWTEDGEATVIIIDGLDHVPREQSPTRSLLEELPAPASLGDGVYVILGTQAIDVLPLPVQNALNTDDRIIDLPPLSAAEVDQLAKAAGPGKWLLPGQRQRLHSASEGHPLALTYLLEELVEVELSETDLSARANAADAVLENASSYGREVEARYRGYFRAIGDDRNLRDLLATVARLRAPIHLDWLATWVDSGTISEFQRRTSVFFRRDGRVWRFVHNSFRRFLEDETARVDGVVDAVRNENLHAALADRCANTDEDWPLYRDEEIAHRLLAGQNDRVLALATPVRLREGLLSLRPPGTIRDQAIIALRAASSIDDMSAYVRILILLNELWQRNYVLDDEKLAKAVTELDPARGLEHVIAGGQLRIDQAAALDLAAELARRGLLDAARDIVSAVGGLAGIVHHTDQVRLGEIGEAAADWGEVVLHLSGLKRVFEELDEHLPLPADPDSDETDTTDRSDREHQNRRDRDSAIINARNRVHARCFDVLTELRDEANLSTLVDVIDGEASPAWSSRARIVRAIAAYEDGDVEAVHQWIGEFSQIDAALAEASPAAIETHDASSESRRLPLSLRLEAAELLIRAGSVEADEIDVLIPPGTIADWPSVPSGTDGLDPYRRVLALWRLGEIRPGLIDYQSHRGAAASWDAGKERFSGVLRLLARLEAQQVLATIGMDDSPAVAAEADPIVRLLELPGSQTHDWTGWYSVREAASELFERLIRLAAKAGGPLEVGLLLDRFTAAWTNPDRSDYWTPHLQQAVLGAVLAVGDDSIRTRVYELLELLETQIDDKVADPHSRSGAWLSQAETWEAAGDSQRALAALQTAINGSIGPGFHDDDPQLSQWLDWLLTSFDSSELSQSEFLGSIRNYARRLIAAAPEAQGQAEEAAERLVELAWRASPKLACVIGEKLCDNDVVGESLVIQAVLAGAAGDPVVEVGLVAILAAELLLPILQGEVERLRELIAAHDDLEGRQNALDLIASAAAVWSLLSDDEADSDAETADEGPEDGGVPGPTTAPALLVVMRQATDRTTSPSGGWLAAVNRIREDTVSPAVARALADEAQRLGLDGESMGALAGVVAHAGEVERASALLTEALARTPTYGWLRFYDGGSRLKIFQAALRERRPEFTRIAANDLAGVLARGGMSGQISPADLYSIVAVIGGETAVATAWSDVEGYLDVFAPMGAETLAMPVSGDGPERSDETLLHWTAGYLGHPVRPLDFGARRVLHYVLARGSDVVQRVLASAILDKGWRAEAALHCLLTVGASNVGRIESGLANAITRATSAPDEIIRELAGSLAAKHGLAVVEPPNRSLPNAYRLSLPPLPARKPPELDKQGVPYLDEHDPQQFVAPYDLPLRHLASMSSLDESAVVHRAASVARTNDEQWLLGGHRAHANRLRQRGQMHTYRPWAYMAGRRALGVVLSELLDAGVLPDVPDLASFLGLIDQTLTHVQPLPLESSTPLPWRSPGTASYEVRGWCDESEEAARTYASAARASDQFVLAERSEWRSLEWGRPEETRTIDASHGPKPSPHLVLPVRPGSEKTFSGADAYPGLSDIEWSERELVVRGEEPHSDARWFEWLAIHPAVASGLGWVFDDRRPFGWIGPDGGWRAWTIRRARGQLSHRPPAHDYCAEVWQVVVSDPGVVELQSEFGDIRRTITVTRTLPARPREGRPHDVRAEASVVIDGG